MVLSQRAGLPAGLANYDDWRLDDLLMQVAELTDLSHYIDPVTERMAGHDRREGTQLIKTVDAYLRCANNAQAAARLLGIHKNTMYARLERIQQLFDVDLESGETCQSLALSLRMRRVLAWRGDPVTK
jgi:purine catabolism regulator